MAEATATAEHETGADDMDVGGGREQEGAEQSGEVCGQKRGREPEPTEIDVASPEPASGASSAGAGSSGKPPRVRSKTKQQNQRARQRHEYRDARTPDGPAPD